MSDRALLGWLLVLALASAGHTADDKLTPEQEKKLQRALELNKEGSQLYRQGQYAPAVERLREALRIWEAIYSKERYPDRKSVV